MMLTTQTLKAVKSFFICLESVPGGAFAISAEVWQPDQTETPTSTCLPPVGEQLKP